MKRYNFPSRKVVAPRSWAGRFGALCLESVTCDWPSNVSSVSDISSSSEQMLRTLTNISVTKHTDTRRYGTHRQKQTDKTNKWDRNRADSSMRTVETLHGHWTTVSMVKVPYLRILKSNLSKAHETRDSLSSFFRRLSRSISSHFGAIHS